MNMMYGLDEDLQKRESADGSMEYPAVSCRAIKDCHPEKTDGQCEELMHQTFCSIVLKPNHVNILKHSTSVTECRGFFSDFKTQLNYKNILYYTRAVLSVLPI